MIENKEKYLKMLEYDKILKMLSEEIYCKDSGNKILDINPINSLELVKKELIKTDDIYKLTIKFGRPNIQPISNVKEILNRGRISARLNNKEFLVVLHLLNNINALLKWKKQSEDINTSIDYLFEKLNTLKDLKNEIVRIIISDEEIADDSSPELLAIRKRIRTNSHKIKNSLDKLIKSPYYQKYLQDPIITIRDGRFVIPVKSEYRSEIQGLIHDTSSSGATLFIEPISVVEVNNEIKFLEGQEKNEIRRILDELSKMVAININELKMNYELLLEIDIYFAKAQLAFKMNASLPTINDEGKIRLNKARHPLIDSNKVVPIDINLGYEFNMLIITGPNTGGKTVALKTVGLLTLMAMSGLLIPANDNSEISIFNNILVDIGDEQSIEQNLSTFSSHMINIISILNCIDNTINQSIPKSFYQNNSLVLMDELGAGTDPTEGASLAIAILDQLHNKKVKTISTTHYSDLKLYATNTNRVENASCEFDIETLKPTYKLSIGIAGKSNAYAISKRLGLNECIIDKAKSFVSSDVHRFEDAIADVELLKSDLEKKQTDILKMQHQIEVDKVNVEKYKKELEKRANLDLDSARIKAEKIIANAKVTIDQLIDNLNLIIREKDQENFRNMAVDIKSKVKSSIKELDESISSLKKKKVKEYIPNRKIQSGDNVKILDVDQSGIAIEDEDKNGYIKVQIGMIKTKVHTSNLLLISNFNNHNTKTLITKSISDRSSAKVQTEIHLRGMPIEEALLTLDKFIDDAILIKLSTIKIVHGKGTGKLRLAISDFLKRNNSIESYRVGIYGEGEEGVTIAKLKF